jgi:hypothetical protein
MPLQEFRLKNSTPQAEYIRSLNTLTLRRKHTLPFSFVRVPQCLDLAPVFVRYFVEKGEDCKR